MPRRYVEDASATRSLGRALEAGALEPLRWSRSRKGYSPHSWKADYAGNCSAPVHIFRDGVRLTKHGESHVFGRHAERPVMTELQVRCRQCEQCLAARAAHWRLRAQSEWRAAARTWFGTLTLSPDAHFRVLVQARLQCSKNGIVFDALPDSERFAERHKIISKEITRYVKRLRKESGAELRILCVVEAHKSGLPHYHMLVHEASPTHSISHACLKHQWRQGFSHWKLVQDPRAAGYVTKYLAKSSMARVRASLDYGNPPTPSGIASLGRVETDGHPTSARPQTKQALSGPYLEAPHGIP